MRPVNNCYWYVWDAQEDEYIKQRIDFEAINEAVERKMLEKL
jgi:hypothetical protein